VLHAEGHTDMSKPVVAFRDYANTTINYISHIYTYIHTLTYIFSFPANILSFYPKHFYLKHQLTVISLLGGVALNITI
jgi:hypothetical protein